MTVRAWQAHDTGLVAVLPRFRRLAGRVRHHRGAGPDWPPEVTLDVVGAELVVVGVGRWPLAGVTARRITSGPPVQFVVDLGPEGSVLLSAAADPLTEALLADLGAPAA